MTTLAQPSLRPVEERDLAAINEIYNHYVRHATCTYQIDPEPLAGRVNWWKSHTGRFPAVVVESNQQIIGWGSLSPYHSRCAFRFTAEDSLYVHPEHHRKGIGRMILTHLIAQARIHRFHSLIAAISADQTPSMCLHASLGFQKIGHFTEVGYKFDRWLDLAYFQLLLRS